MIKKTDSNILQSLKTYKNAVIFKIFGIILFRELYLFFRKITSFVFCLRKIYFYYKIYFSCFFVFKIHFFGNVCTLREYSTLRAFAKLGVNDDQSLPTCWHFSVLFLHNNTYRYMYFFNLWRSFTLIGLLLKLNPRV